MAGHARVGVDVIRPAAELGCAALLAGRLTAALDGLASAALFAMVFPANVQMTLDGGVAGAGSPANSAVLAWLRLPLQIPLILWASSVARSTRGHPQALTDLTQQVPDLTLQIREFLARSTST